MNPKYLYVITSVLIFAFILAVILKSTLHNNTWETFGTTNPEADEVSLISLIANPAKYEGKIVRVKGVSIVEHDGTALYFSQDDYKNAVTKNAISLDISTECLDVTLRQLADFNSKYVSVEGIFTSEYKGAHEAFSGELKNTSYYECIDWSK